MVSSELYPFEGQYLDLDGLRYHYVDEGPRDARRMIHNRSASPGTRLGPPGCVSPAQSNSRHAVVMLHGNPSWSFYYRELIKALRPDHRVIAPDHIGCGRSDKPSDARYSYTMARRVADLDRLIAHLGLERITLIVHDWGGMIGMAWATQHPQLIDRVVVMNTAAFELPRTKAFPAALTLARLPGLGALLVRGLSAFSRGANRFCVTRRPMSREVAQGYLAPYDNWHNRIAVHRFVQDIPLRAGHPTHVLVHETSANLASLRDKPMLICWGLRDFVFDRHFLAEWERRFPAAQVQRYEDAGHYVLEDATSEIIDAVRQFLLEPT